MYLPAALSKLIHTRTQKAEPVTVQTRQGALTWRPDAAMTLQRDDKTFIIEDDALRRAYLNRVAKKTAICTIVASLYLRGVDPEELLRTFAQQL